MKIQLVKVVRQTSRKDKVSYRNLYMVLSPQRIHKSRNQGKESEVTSLNIISNNNFEEFFVLLFQYH